VAELQHAFGYEPDPDGAAAFVATLPRPTLATAGPGLETDEKTPALLYPALLECHPTWQRGSQGNVGSCVGWGSALAVDFLQACDIVWRREPERWGGRTIESATYGFSRVEARGLAHNNGGDGSTGFHAAKGVREFGTLHYGIDYDGTVFDGPSQARDREWGRFGVPDKLEPHAAKRKVREVTLVTNFMEAARAIANGYPCTVASGQGFSMSRDEQGFCRAGGTWWHLMCLAGLRWDRPGLLCFNSWGRSNTTGKHWPADMPEEARVCSFWIDAEVIDRMLSGRDSYAYAGFSGFEPTRIPDWTGGVL
jgi:hypothetical protein